MRGEHAWKRNAHNKQAADQCTGSDSPAASSLPVLHPSSSYSLRTLPWHR
jgi:hypothetical protein